MRRFRALPGAIDAVIAASGMVVSEEVVLPNGLPEADIAEASKGEDGSQSTAEGASCKSKHSPAPSTDSFSSSYTPTLYHVDTNTTIVLNAELITSKAQKVLRLLFV